MTEPSASDPATMRASDQDRERVAELLRDAAGEGRLDMGELDERLDAVYSAKTYAELEPITRDLPQAGSARPAPPVPAPLADPARFGGQPTSSAAVAVMGGFERKGAWVVPPSFTAVAFMGGGTIDMRDARFAERTVAIHATAIMGGIEIVVPEDAQVHVSGFGFMGGFEHRVSGEGQPDGPVIQINGVAFMGGVAIKRRPPRDAARRDKLEAKRQKLEAKLEGKMKELRSRLEDD
jgi:Domain of unknown function (DUF1707)/Cell wall-active antibiotics response 4TMS YvqF